MTKPFIAIASNLDYRDNNEYIDLTRAYSKAVATAGGLPLVIPITSDVEDIEHYLSLVSGLLLPGGVDVDPLLFGEEPEPGLGEVKPELDNFHIKITKLALNKSLPILGICRGAQILNVVAGGTIIQHIEPVEGILKHKQNSRLFHPTHSVKAERGTLIESILGSSFTVNSFHHQAVGIPGKNLKVSARAKDGVIEAIEMIGYPFAVGVQWHPEEMLMGEDRTMAPLFSSFVSACGRD